jgi:hypothetical protein
MCVARCEVVLDSFLPDNFSEIRQNLSIYVCRILNSTIELEKFNRITHALDHDRDT